MSRSNPNVKNPAVRFFQWRGGEEGGGKLEYYDKSEEQSIEVKLPFTFLVLDELNTVSGFSKAEKSSFWSNEVKDVVKDIMTVKTKGGTRGRGTWAELKNSITGAKYAKSVYAAFKDDTGEMVIGNLKLMGAALTQWIEFQKKYDVEQCAVMITDTPKKEKNGSNTYFVPVFEAREVSASTDNEAKRLDIDLQNYLKSYFNRDPEEDVKYATSADELVEVAVEIEDLDANEQTESGEAPAEPTQKPPKEPVADGEIPLKDVPF